MVSSHMPRALVFTAALLALAPLADAASVTLLWEAGEGATPQGYVVERRSGNAPFAEIARPDTPPYTDSSVPALISTCWQVKAYNQIGVSLASNLVCLDLPNAPVNVSISTNGPTAVQTRVTVNTKVRKRYR